MIRRKRRSLSRSQEYEEDINPMENTANISDAMLVLAVGIMLALIMSWQLDFNMPDSVKELKNAETLTEEQVQQVEGNDALQEKGTVYQDPNTGKFYVRQD